jgi:hypothetical protein
MRRTPRNEYEDYGKFTVHIMARDKRVSSAEPQAQEEMTVILLKFRGDSQTLQKGFDVVSQAISALGSRPHSVAHRQPQPLLSDNTKVIDDEAQHSPEQTNDDEIPPGDTALSGNGKTKKAHYTKCNFLTEFDLSPPDVPSLKEYCTEKNPQTDNERYLVVSAWIQTHGGVNPFTPSHVFTCFRAMEWKEQQDFTQPMRLMKSKKSYYEIPGRGEWRLTGIGLEAAENIKNME